MLPIFNVPHFDSFQGIISIRKYNADPKGKAIYFGVCILGCDFNVRHLGEDMVTVAINCGAIVRVFLFRDLHGPVMTSVIAGVIDILPASIFLSVYLTASSF